MQSLAPPEPPSRPVKEPLTRAEAERIIKQEGLSDEAIMRATKLAALSKSEFKAMLKASTKALHEGENSDEAIDAYLKRLERNKATASKRPASRSKRFYGASLLKRTRRTQTQMGDVLTSIQTILAGEDGQITIRHLFYRLVGLNVIEKTEAAYKGLCGHLSKWRRSEEIPWGAFADNTRWHIRHKTFDGIEEALRSTAETYRRNLWSTQPFYLEAWVEKDSIASIVAGKANSFGVPVFVARGFASLSSLYSAANTFREAVEAGKQVIIYHLGDYAPRGVAAGESMLRAFRDDFGVEVQFTRIAVTQEQIRKLNLPTRPVKGSDTRAAKWTGGECVELDSMPPAEIRKLVEACITRHIDVRQWNILRETEAGEREQLKQIWRAKT